MAQYEQFSTCLKRILEEERLSASQAAKLVGFRSRNSIFRILTDQTSVRVQEEFLLALKKQLEDQWPQRHWLDLEKALEIERMGMNDFLSREAFRKLINADGKPQQEMLLNITKPDRGYITRSLRPLLKQLVSSGTIEITICGCCSVPLCNLLAEELSQVGAEGRVKVRHFVSMKEAVAVQNVIAIQPLLYFSWYEPLLVETGACPEEMIAIYSAGSVIIQRTDAHGVRTWHQLLLHHDSKMFLAMHHGCDMNDTLRLLNYYGASLPKLKSCFSCFVTADDYVKYTETYRKLEYDREILSMKPDVPINYIHPDILLPAVIDGFKASGFVGQDEMRGYLQQFYDIHLLRYENFLKKRKVTHVVFSLEAMRKFMLTGQQSDHFFAMRPYTLAERLAILNHLRDETANNPYFSVRFLKADRAHPSMEVTLYGGVGVLFTKSDTHYHLTGDHSEALVSHPGFMKKFRDFFIHELLKEHVMSHQETMAAMNDLAREAANFG